MPIAANTVVSLRYRLFDDQDAMIEDAQVVDYLHGGYGQIFEAVEAALEGRDIGDALLVELAPAQAFGDIDPALMRSESRDRFPREVRVGMEFEGASPDGQHRAIYRITAVSEETVEVDGNHPLAGRGLRFDCQVLGVRKAAREEMTHGHAHGAHGHHH